MRNSRCILTAAICLITVVAGTGAFAQEPTAFVQGFGSVRLDSTPVAALRGVNRLSSGAFGGIAGVNLTPNIQAIGELGRVGDLLPATTQTLLAFSPYDVRVSAWYGEGGVRLTTGSSLTVQPYFETLAGLSRLRASVGGFGGYDPYVNAALGFLTRTRPVATLGAGVVFQKSSVMLDAGYRFNRIFASGSFADALTAGEINTNQVRVGIGVRF